MGAPSLPSSVLITGTTSGVGCSLMDYYVRNGIKVISVNRRRVPELEARYPVVRFECVDVRSTEEVAKLVAELDRAGSLPQAFILNAGINREDNDETFNLTVYREVLETNLFGVLNFVQPLTALKPRLSPIRITAISSMGAYAANPYGLGYHSSKKTITACFDIWSKMYAGTDLIFQRVMLGPVRTAIYTMGEKFPKWMVWIKDLFSASLNDTAVAIAKFSGSRNSVLIFPFQAWFLFKAMRIAQCLIPGFFQGRKTLDGKPRRAREGS